jgi:hypothetical protein
MSIQNFGYHLNNQLFNYHGKTSLKVFVRKVDQFNRTTYFIGPIRAQSRLFAWLQEHSQFFNRIITAHLSRSLKKDPNCKILDGMNIGPRSNGSNFINALMDKVENATDGFFQDDHEDHFKEIYRRIIHNPIFSKDQIINLIIPTVTSPERQENLLEVLENEDSLLKKIRTKLNIEEKTVDDEIDLEDEQSKKLNDWSKTIFQNNWNGYLIYIYLPQVKFFPEKVLELFYDSCFKNEKRDHNLVIKALDEDLKEIDAIDAGGLRRQFISDLFEALARKATSGKSSFFAAHKNSVAGWLPVLSDYDIEKQENLYIAIGKLMGMCLTSVGQSLWGLDTSYVIGKIFDPAVFDVIAAAPPRVLYTGFENLDDDSLLALYTALEKGKDNQLLQYYQTPDLRQCNEDTLRDMISYAYMEDLDEMPKKLKGNPSKGTILEHQKTIREQLKMQLIDCAKANESLPLIFKMAEGIAYNEIERDEWQNKDWTSIGNLEMRIQGSFDKQNIKDAFLCYSTTKNYIDQWIDQSDDAMVKMFLKAATGSTAIAANIKINIRYSDDKNRLPEYHTCARTIDIPEYDDFATFKSKLEQSFICLEKEAFQDK